MPAYTAYRLIGLCAAITAAIVAPPLDALTRLRQRRVDRRARATNPF